MVVVMCSVLKDTVQDFSENCTTHGISYIFQREQALTHRIIWVFIVAAGIGFACYLSYGAYRQWEEDPIITTVSTTARPITKLEYPAITICGQGMDTETLTTVIESQFKRYLTKKGVDYDKLTPAERKAKRSEFESDSYPGATVSLGEIANMMSSPDPSNAVGAKTIGDAVASSRSTLRGGCPRGWVSTTKNAPFASTYCYFAVQEKHSLESAKKLCEAQNFPNNGILLEIDTRKELQDIKTLVNDRHLPFDPETAVWLDVKFDDHDKKYKFNYGRMATEKIMDLAYPRKVNQHCATFRPTEGKLRPVACNESTTHPVLCTLAISTQFRRRRSTDASGKEGQLRKREASPSPPPYDMFITDDPAIKEKARKQKEESIKKYQEVFRSMNLTGAYENLFQLLWHSINPCYDIKEWTSEYQDQKSTIKRCYWKGVKVSCSAIFRTNPTDKGMCCTFNALEAERLYQESKFSEMVSRLQEDNRQNAFDAGNPPKGFDTGDEPIPEIGKTRGLTLILDSHSDILSASTVSDDYEGFLAVVNERSKFPSLQEKGFVIRPGHENLVAISAVDTAADEAIRKVPPVDRRCYFRDEYQLDLHKLYSQSGCVFECLLKTGKEEKSNLNGCTPWFYPSQNTIMCDPWQTNVFVKSIFEGGASTKCDYCLPDCNGTIYTTSVSATPLRRCDAKNLGLSVLCQFEEKMYPRVWSEQVIEAYKDMEELPSYILETIERGNARRSYFGEGRRAKAVFKDLYKEEKQRHYNAFQKDIALVHFFFHEPTVFQFKRSLRMTWVDFISQIGGVLGLCVGFSLISGLEIIYWFTLRLGLRLVNRHKDKTQDVWIQPAPYWIQPMQQK